MRPGTGRRCRRSTSGRRSARPPRGRRSPSAAGSAGATRPRRRTSGVAAVAASDARTEVRAPSSRRPPLAPAARRGPRARGCGSRRVRSRAGRSGCRGWGGSQGGHLGQPGSDHLGREALLTRRRSHRSPTTHPSDAWPASPPRREPRPARSRRARAPGRRGSRRGPAGSRRPASPGPARRRGCPGRAARAPTEPRPRPATDRDLVAHQPQLDQLDGAIAAVPADAARRGGQPVAPLPRRSVGAGTPRNSPASLIERPVSA